MSHTEILSFKPPQLIAGGNMQTLLPRIGPAKLLNLGIKRQLAQHSRSVVLHCGDIGTEKNVRLHGVYCPPAISTQPSKRLVILIHGWEGSYTSAYILSLSQQLRLQGHATFRLHLRDHGPSHHLNRQVFHSLRLPETIHAIESIITQFNASSYLLCGFSLGGNFALRIGAQAPQLPMTKIYAINPLIDPKTAAERVKQNPLYHYYFFNKWKRSLLLKERLFKGLIDKAKITQCKDYFELTDYFIDQLTPFQSSEEYYQAYRIDQRYLDDISTPTDIFISQNDPVIPFSDAAMLNSNKFCQLYTTASGGHCGYQSNLLGASWMDRHISQDMNTL